jgi:hypothetical protein
VSTHEKSTAIIDQTFIYAATQDVNNCGASRVGGEPSRGTDRVLEARATLIISRLNAHLRDIRFLQSPAHKLRPKCLQTITPLYTFCFPRGVQEFMRWMRFPELALRRQRFAGPIVGLVDAR